MKRSRLLLGLQLAIALVLTGGAVASKPRLRLERVAATEDGKLRVFASLVALEGTVDGEQPGAAFQLEIDGRDAGAAVRRAPFQAGPDNVDLVLVVETSALYGPPAPTPPRAPPPPPPAPRRRGPARPPRGPAVRPPRPTPVPLPAAGPEPLDQVKDGLRELLESLGPRVRTLVIDYGGEVNPHPPFRPAPAAASAVDELRSDTESGDLRLVDALRAALVELNRPRPGPGAARRLIVVVSDGLNSQMDRRTFRALGEEAARARVPIHSIAFSPTDERGPLLNLGELSKRSIGTLRWARTAADLKAQLDTLLEEIQQQYVLTFAVDPGALEGKTLRLKAAGLTSNPLVVSGRDLPPQTRRWPWIALAGLGGALLAAALLLLVRRLRSRPAAAARPTTGRPTASTATATARAVLILASGAKAGARFPLGKRPLVLGSAAADIRVTDDPTVSSRHASFAAGRRGAAVTDLGSTNGTFVNGTRISGEAALADGDVVRCGATQIKFRME